MGKNQAPNEAKEEPVKKTKDEEFSKQDKADLEQFVQYNIATGELKEEDPSKLSEKNREQFIEGFRSWQKEGKPKPSLPQSAKKHIEVIEKLYRARDRGEEYIFYCVQGVSTPVGINREPIFRKIEIDGEMVEDKSMQIGETQSYTIPYSEDLVEKLLRKAQRDTSNPQLYIKDGIGDSYRKAKIRDPKNFTKPFDELIDKVLRGQRI